MIAVDVTLSAGGAATSASVLTGTLTRRLPGRYGVEHVSVLSADSDVVRAVLYVSAPEGTDARVVVRQALRSLVMPGGGRLVTQRCELSGAVSSTSTES